jgi:hypothetical protein
VRTEFQTVKRISLQDINVDQLVERFTAIALDQDKALLRNEYAKFNRLFEEMEVVKQELKARAGDQRQALLPLYSHPNAQVRLKSAIATLALAPDAARRTLQMISDRNEYPQAAYARDMISGLEDGTFVPS